METSSENREHLNKCLDFQATGAADELTETQRALADKLTAGTLLGWDDLNKLASTQASAALWARARRILAYWGEHPSAAPEAADLVEAVHNVRTEAVRDALGFRPGARSGMSAELENAQQAQRQDFLRATGMIYPKDSPLRMLGRY